MLRNSGGVTPQRVVYIVTLASIQIHQGSQTASAQGHALLAGDFNARGGGLPDPWMTDVGDSILPQLQNTASIINTHGCKLMRLRADSAMIPLHWQNLDRHPCTAYFQASNKQNGFMLGQILVDPDLSSSIQHCAVGPTRSDSDHMPLEMQILLSAAATPPPPVRQHTMALIQGWAKQEQYALALHAGPRLASLRYSSAAAAAGGLQETDGHFNTMH